MDLVALSSPGQGVLAHVPHSQKFIVIVMLGKYWYRAVKCSVTPQEVEPSSEKLNLRPKVLYWNYDFQLNMYHLMV